MSQLQAFPVTGIYDGVVPNDVASSEGVHADLRIGSFPDDANPAMSKLFFEGNLAHLGEDF